MLTNSIKSIVMAEQVRFPVVMTSVLYKLVHVKDSANTKDAAGYT